MARLRPFELARPRAERRTRTAIAALLVSLCLHAVFVTLEMIGHLSAPAERVAADTRGDVNRQIDLPRFEAKVPPKPLPLPTPVAAAPRPVAREVPPEAPAVLPDAPPPTPQAPPPEPPPPAVAATTPPKADTGAPAGPRSPIMPGMAKGKLWVKPLPLPPQELAARLRGDNARPQFSNDGQFQNRNDSVVTAIVQHYLDSLATELASHQGTEAPQWTITIGGREFGIDRGNMRVGGVTIPGVVMGFVRAPDGTNVPHYYESKPSDAMRRDLYEAARRANNYAEFKKSIADIRARNQAQKDFERAQRTPPPPVPDQPSGAP
jgi:hypothetical protein